MNLLGQPPRAGYSLALAGNNKKNHSWGSNPCDAKRKLIFSEPNFFVNS
jgi:hypothetical protein